MLIRWRSRYMAQGSGVYYNVGRTVVFRDHWDALASLPGGHNDRNANAEATPLQQVARLAQAAGLDSVQYTHRLEFLYLHELQDVRDDLGSRCARSLACITRQHTYTGTLRARSTLAGSSTNYTVLLLYSDSAYGLNTDTCCLHPFAHTFLVHTQGANLSGPKDGAGSARWLARQGSMCMHWEAL